MISFKTIASGSSGNCVIFSYNNKKILIDCGISGKKLIAFLNEENINPADIQSILITHEHIDHIKGAGIISRKFNIPIIASKGTWRGMSAIGTTAKRIEFEDNREIPFGDIKITPFSIPHDAIQPTGFVIKAEDKKFAVATDIGHLTKEIAYNLVGCSAVVIEANYDETMLKNGRYPQMLKRRIAGNNGHLNNKDTGKLAGYLVKNGTKRILLGHLSNENNSPEIAFEEVAKELEFQGF
ncbi:MAG: MBL fold metallo-hydrolase, partial [Clostridia bacterium]|nr:MBL fold metallo-hydrolase [Clostridia bacterium]